MDLEGALILQQNELCCRIAGPLRADDPQHAYSRDDARWGKDSLMGDCVEIAGDCAHDALRDRLMLPRNSLANALAHSFVKLS